MFIPQFLAFLNALSTFRAEANILADYLETLGGEGGGGSTDDENFQWAVASTGADSYTIGSSDIFKHVRFTNDVAAELVIPLAGEHGFGIGDCVRAAQLGEGQVTITAASPSITVNTLSGALTTAGPGSVVELTYVGGNEWDGSGDILSNGSLLSGDMTDGDDQILLSGDMTDGDDIEMTSGV